MPVHEGKAEMPCMVKKEVSKKHACCTVKSTKEDNKEKKGCCTGTSKMSCCVTVIALTPNLEKITFLPFTYQKSLFGYTESSSSFDIDIFHPPALV